MSRLYNGLSLSIDELRGLARNPLLSSMAQEASFRARNSNAYSDSGSHPHSNNSNSSNNRRQPQTYGINGGYPCRTQGSARSTRPGAEFDPASHATNDPTGLALADFVAMARTRFPAGVMKCDIIEVLNGTTKDELAYVLASVDQPVSVTSTAAELRYQLYVQMDAHRDTVSHLLVGALSMCIDEARTALGRAGQSSTSGLVGAEAGPAGDAVTTDIIRELVGELYKEQPSQVVVSMLTASANKHAVPGFDARTTRSPLEECPGVAPGIISLVLPIVATMARAVIAAAMSAALVGPGSVGGVVANEYGTHANLTDQSVYSLIGSAKVPTIAVGSAIGMLVAARRRLESEKYDAPTTRKKNVEMQSRRN
jgi:hypothetical protein